MSCCPAGVAWFAPLVLYLLIAEFRPPTLKSRPNEPFVVPGKGSLAFAAAAEVRLEDLSGRLRVADQLPDSTAGCRGGR